MKISFRLVAIAIISSCMLSVQADELPFDVTASAGLGIKNLDFEEKRAGTITESLNPQAVGFRFNNTQKSDVDLFYMDLGLAVAFDRFYVAFNYEVPLEEPTTSKSFASTARQFKTDVDIDRTDWSFSVGANIVGGLTAFAGYKYGETEQGGNDASAAGNAPAGFKQTYEEKGPFVGAVYGIPVADAGVLSFSLAYADLDAEYSESGAFGIPFPSDSTANTLLGPESYSGDATGFSYALAWQGELTERFLYNVALKYQKYELDGRGVRINTTNPNNTGLPAEPSETIVLNTDTTETITALVIGVRYLF